MNSREDRVLGAGVRWYPADTLAAERGRWALWVPVMLGIGIGSYFSLPIEPPRAAVWATMAVALTMALGLRRRPLAPALALAAALVVAGMAVAQERSVRVAAPVITDEIGPVTVDAWLLADSPAGSRRRLLLADPRINGLPATATPARLRVTVPAGAVVPPIGSRVSLRARLMPPPIPATPGDYDFARRAWFERLGGIGFVLGQVMRRDYTDPPLGLRLRAAAARLRGDIARRLADGLPPREAALAIALTTGLKGGLSAEDRDSFRIAGLAHLLAISGLHVGLAAGVVFVSLRAGLAALPPVARRWPIKKWAALAALVAAAFYLVIAGAPVPTRRAFLMTGLVLLAVVLDRRALSMRLVALAATLILVATPESLLGASFQLSFAAVIALIATYERFDPGRRQRGRGWMGTLVAWLIGMAVTTFIAGLATAPFVLQMFGRLAAYGVVANLLAMPVMGFWVMPWAVVALLLMPFGAEGLALGALETGLAALYWVADTVAAWPGAALDRPALPLSAAVVIALSGLWLALWQQPWRWAGAGVMVAALLWGMVQPPPDLLVAGNGRAWAAGGSRMWVEGTRAGGFLARQWQGRLGGGHADGRLPAGLACDALGCVLTRAGRRIAIARKAAALPEDCRRADLVVALVSLDRACSAPLGVVDRSALRRDGGVALWVAANGTVTLRQVAAWRGRRPWSGGGQ